MKVLATGYHLLAPEDQRKWALGRIDTAAAKVKRQPVLVGMMSKCIASSFLMILTCAAFDSLSHLVIVLDFLILMQKQWMFAGLDRDGVPPQYPLRQSLSDQP